MGPDFARIGFDEEGEVADESHAAGVGVILEGDTAAEEQELLEGNALHLVAEFAASFIQGGGFAESEGLGPL